MNHAYRLFWSEIQAGHLLQPRTSRRRGKALGAALLASLATTAHGLPEGGQVSAGQGSISRNGSALAVTQQTQNLSINWQKFGIGADESVNFTQPKASSIALNRVLGADPSAIFGRLSANGQVWIINPNGVLFGADAHVNVGGLLASTLQISDADFLAGKRSFTGSGGSIINRGNLGATGIGYVALLGGRVSNEGVIEAKLGTVALGAGNRITLDFAGDRLIGLQVDQGAVDALAQNRQLIRADGGTVILTAKAADALMNSVVNNEGAIEARTIDTRNGTIRLLGAGGSVEVSGTLDASAPTGGHGGFIETSGERVRIADGTLVTTAAPQGQTGQWLIDPTDFNIAPSGGDITGAGLSSQLNSSNVTILSASGSASGAGDINVNDSVAWNSANSLTLSALHSINVNRPISNGGTGGVSLRADNTGLCIVGASRCGTINFGGTGHITVNGGPVDLYYNPIGSSKAGPGGPSYATPTNYSPRVTLNGGSALTAWMLVNDVTQLQAMQTNLGGDYALGNDIDASATSGWNGGAGFAPVGGPAFGPFAGRFDGGGHAISGLTIVRADSDYIGLFGAVAPGASVKNVGLTAANVKGSHAVGSLAGSSAGTVSNVHASGIVFGRAYYGGLIGSNDGGTVTAADSEASVFGESIYAGGLIGYNSGTVSDSHATGSVGSTENTVGGLVGYNDYGGTLTRVYATGGVRGGFSSGFVGGLVGQNNGTIADAYATGNASGNQFSSAIGGLVGYNLGSLSHVHASGNVIGGRQPINLGGLIGANEGVVSEAYATGEVSGAAAVFIGGLIGNNRGSVTSSYATGAVNVSDLFLDNGVSAGGLVGLNEFGGTLDRVFASGNVSGGRDGNAIGGLVGENSGAVSNAYATGRASGNSTVGGLVGVNRGTLTTSYSLGTVTGNEFVGGLVGNNQFGTVTYSYWDVDTSHQATSDGGIGLSDVKMKQPASFAGFDFANTWSIQKNKSYPQLRVFLSPSP